MFIKAAIGFTVMLVAASSALAAIDGVKDQHYPWESRSVTPPTFDDLHDGCCHGSHPVLSNPGSGGR
jgi:hypothetical protein